MRGGKQLGVFASLGTLLLGVFALGATGYLLRGRVLYAAGVTAQAQADLQRRDLAAGCGNLIRAADAWRRADALSQPLAPLLRRLGWMPQLGADLRAAPDAIALARHGAAAGASACRVLKPALAATNTPERLAAAARQLSQHPAELAGIEADLVAAQQAWQRIAPLVDQSSRLAPYRAQLQTFDRLAPDAIQHIGQLRQSAPQLPGLLGLGSPRRYLVVLQNPFELRPTGGFIGLVCVVQVAEARPSLDRCQPSETYTAPATTAMPFAYTRYLRLGNWYLRDANWSPDFPTTARAIQDFWAINEQPAVDGVIAVDPYALVPLLRATGPLKLGDGSAIDADQIVAAILSRYYDGAIYRDKGQLGELLPALLQQLLATDSAALPQLLAALNTAAAERHLLIALNQPELAALHKAQGWDGSLSPASGDTLRIVDADVGYGAVNAFVERLTDYDVALDAEGRPLTATLTLTYTNRYSPWAEAPTAYAVNGQCTDPATLQLEQRPGCYANYLRVYVPLGSRLLDAQGFEESLGADQQHQRTIFGGYLRVQPGEERVLRLSYRLPSLAPGTLTIEKQPGTLAPPIMITARTPQRQATLWTSGRTDLRVAIRASGSDLTLNGPQDQAAAQAFARHSAWHTGLARWQRGDREAALRIWQAGAALDRALDHARTLPTDAAIALTGAITAVETGGRAFFEQAAITEAQGEPVADLYRQAAERSAENPLAQLTWARQQVISGADNPTMQQVAPASSAVRRWRAAADALEQTGRLADAASYLDVLLRVVPDDRATALRHADLLLRTGQQALALGRYELLAAQSDIWGRLAAARQAQINGESQAAIARYSEALPLAADYPTAFRIGDGLRDLGAQAAALQAYDRAASLAPGSIWPLLAAGDMLRGNDPAAARAWYGRAQQTDPASGYPDFALGTMLLQQGDTAGALRSFGAAASKQPEVQLFQETLDRVEAQQRSGAMLAPARVRYLA
jgi:tetratricopeptide (TPR) repeat protein